MFINVTVVDNLEHLAFGKSGQQGSFNSNTLGIQLPLPICRPSPIPSMLSTFPRKVFTLPHGLHSLVLPLMEVQTLLYLPLQMLFGQDK